MKSIYLILCVVKFPNWCVGRIYQPLDHINEYFGSKIALYFAFIEHYNISLLPPAAVGIAVQIVLVRTKNPAHPILPFYTVFILLWAEIFLQTWHTTQSKIAFKWGNANNNNVYIFFYDIFTTIFISGVAELEVIDIVRIGFRGYEYKPSLLTPTSI